LKQGATYLTIFFFNILVTFVIKSYNILAMEVKAA
jgi:hypothetical protein